MDRLARRASSEDLPGYDHLSVDPSLLALPRLDALPSIPRALTPGMSPAAGGVPIGESGEPLVPLDPDSDRVGVVNAYFVTGWAGTSSVVWLRSAVRDRLVGAAGDLPGGFGLAVYDGWRSMTTVRALYNHFYGPGSTLAPGFLADPDDVDVVPPHLTGGALDVTLTWRGAALSLGTSFDDFTPLAHLRSLESEEEDPLRSLRRLLYRTMIDAGFAPFDQEWWHYSWGDQDWAAWTGSAVAHYGATEPH